MFVGLLNKQTNMSKLPAGEVPLSTISTINHETTHVPKNILPCESLYGIPPAYKLLKVWVIVINVIHMFNTNS